MIKGMVGMRWGRDEGRLVFICRTLLLRRIPTMEKDRAGVILHPKVLTVPSSLRDKYIKNNPKS